jgi:hypothetical protein
MPRSLVSGPQVEGDLNGLEVNDLPWLIRAKRDEVCSARNQPRDATLAKNVAVRRGVARLPLYRDLPTGVTATSGTSTANLRLAINSDYPSEAKEISQGSWVRSNRSAHPDI